LNFKNYYNQCVSYYLSPDPTASTTKRFKISRLTGVTTQADFISPAQISMDSLHFILNEATTSQPMITINLQAHALNTAQNKSALILQTSLTSRYYK
jgi:hypothetical protein